MVSGSGKDIGIKNRIGDAPFMPYRHIEQTWMTFAMNPRSDCMSEAIIGFMRKTGIPVSDLAKIQQCRIALHFIELALDNDALFLVEACIAKESRTPVVRRFIDSRLYPIATIPDTE